MMARITIVQWDPTKTHRIFIGIQPMLETAREFTTKGRVLPNFPNQVLRAQFLSRYSSYCLGCSL